MTVPIDYRNASADFDRFLLDARDQTDLTTTNQVWGALLGVFHVFRRRLTPAQALIFAKALPPLLRSAFVEDWHFESTPAAFGDLAAMNAEVRNYRNAHQFAPDNAIQAFSTVIWRHVDEARFRRVLDQLPAGAKRFWASGRSPA